MVVHLAVRVWPWVVEMTEELFTIFPSAVYHPRKAAPDLVGLVRVYFSPFFASWEVTEVLPPSGL